MLARLAEEFEGRVDFTDCNVYDDMEKASMFGIRSTPTLVFLGRDGKEASRLVGYAPEDVIRERIELLLAE